MRISGNLVSYHKKSNMQNLVNLLKFLFFVISIYFGNVTSLTSNDCLGYNASYLYTAAVQISTSADKKLLSSTFFKNIGYGFWYTVVNETVGVDMGGETNPFGVYGTLLFKNTSILPAGICNIPSQNGDNRCSGGITDSFLLGPSDVIAFVSCSPPPVKYFGHDMIIGTRLTEEYPFYPGQNFGDTINMRTFNDRNSGKPSSIFDQPTLILASADKSAAEKVKEAYIKAGMDVSSIFIRQISSETVQLWDRSNGKSWKESKPDILTHISRISVPLEGFQLIFSIYLNRLFT